jgi:chromosome segregation ATPase
MDNPMTILSQDNARQFLNNSTASEKYRFFIKGVQLEQLSQDYQLLEENIDFIEGTFPEKMEGVKKLKEEMERAQQLLALSEKHDGMRAKIKRLFLQMAWVQVVEQERLRDKHEKEINTVDEKIAHLEQKVHHCSEQFQEAHEALDRAETDVTTFKEECEPIIAEEEVAKEKYGDSKKEATALHV